MMNIEMQHMIQQDGKKTSYYGVTYNYDGTGKLSLTSFGMVYYPDNNKTKKKKIAWGSVSSKEFNPVFLSVQFHLRGIVGKKSHIFKLKDRRDFDTIQQDLVLRLDNTDLSTVKLDNCKSPTTTTARSLSLPPTRRISAPPDSKKKKMTYYDDYLDEDDFPSQSFEKSITFAANNSFTANNTSTSSSINQLNINASSHHQRQHHGKQHHGKQHPDVQQQQQLIIGQKDKFKDEEEDDDVVAVFEEEEGGGAKGEGGERQSLIPDGFEMVDLDDNIYSLIFTSPVNGIGFWFAMTICLFQTCITILVILDSTDFQDENPIDIPPGNDLSVIIAQGMLMIILPHVSDDMMEGLEFLVDGYHPEVLDVCPNGTYWKWALAGFLHFGVGALMMSTVFILLMQQTEVIELGLVFVEFGFFAEIDNIAFVLGEKGLCSVPLRNAIEDVANCKIIKRATYTWNHRIRDTLLSIVLLIGYGILIYLQEQGQFLCKNIFVQWGDIFNPFIVGHSGMFDSLGINNQHDGRVVYEERGMGDLRLAYCRDIGRWTMTEHKNGEDFHPCGSGTIKILAWSEEDYGYSILETKDTWHVDPVDGGQGSEGFQPFVHFHMACNECSDECDGQCDVYGNCICPQGHYGVNCEYPEPCSLLVLNEKTKPFTPEDLGRLDFPEKFELLTFQDGSNKTRTDTFQVEYRPVYYGEDDVDHTNVEQFLMFFTGRRWVITQTKLNGIWLDSKKDVVDYMSSPDFDLISSKFEPYFTSEVMDVDEPSNHDSPDRLKWYYVRKNGYNDDYVTDSNSWWKVAEDEPAGTSFNCAFCDWEHNPCESYGQCQQNRTCWCPPGFVGALCEREILCTDAIDENPDAKQGCVFESATCHISGRCRGCPEGYIGARCQVQEPLQLPPHLQYVKPTSTIVNQP